MTDKDIVQQIVLKSLNTEDANKLLAFFETTDYYTAPASTKYHGAVPGGLCRHCIEVYESLNKVCSAFHIKANCRDVALAALCHDLCKLNMYNPITDETGKIIRYEKDEKFKYGSHGGKSVYLLMHIVDISDELAVAINNHMGAFDNSSVGQVYETNSLAWALHVADEASAYKIDLV